MSAETAVIERDCVIAGGGPAGMFLGHLLARAGLRVTVLEKHADFLRDFRGDTIHPSTITLLGELGLRERFLELPIDRVEHLDVLVNGTRLSPIDFATLGPPDDFLVLAPQWDLLNFLVAESERFPTFEVRMRTAATDLVRDDAGAVVGLLAEGPDGPIEFRTPLTVAADGRHSTLRPAAGLVPIETGVPIDVLWFDLPVPEDPGPPILFALDANGFALSIPRGDHWQGGYIIPKGGLDELRAAGLAEFHRRVGLTAPFVAPVIDSVADWDQVKLLSVQIDRLATWHLPGFIAIGDAAHAMSPVGGVGVNYAIQDAVALANAAAGPLRAGAVPESVLAAVQRRREAPVRKMQRIQRLIHGRIARAATGKGSPVPPALLRILVLLLPRLRRRLTRFMGLGFLPEHVQDGAP